MVANGCDASVDVFCDKSLGYHHTHCQEHHEAQFPHAYECLLGNLLHSDIDGGENNHGDGAKRERAKQVVERR